MQIDLDVAGRRVVVFGDSTGARRTVRRFVAEQAKVTHVVAGVLPEPADRIDAVRYLSQPRSEDRAAVLRIVGPAWLVVLVGTPDPLRTELVDLAGHLRAMLVEEEPAPASGSVVLVGGGPGRTSLLTLQAAQALRDADVIFYDRLAPTADLMQLAPGVELFDVGKSPYHHPVTQRSIEELMIERARRGQSVVRLKGGDPFVFGRGGEEMQACLAAGVPVQVVPGVSSSVAVPGACGVPVTHREISHCFTVISGHQPIAEHELAALAALGQTLVILMGVANLDQITAGLLRAGMAAEVPVAVIERGFSDSQRSTFSTVGRLAADVRRLDVTSPAVVVIGEVVRLAPELSGSPQLSAGWPYWSVEEARGA